MTSPLRIVVVENHRDTLTYLSLYLQQMGHTVLSTHNQTEALACLPSAACDVLISDIGLPDGSGWELLRAAQLPATVYCIAMSGFGAGSDRSRSKAAGFRQHLLKPFDPTELDGMLAEASLERDQRVAGAG